MTKVDRLFIRIGMTITAQRKALNIEKIISQLEQLGISQSNLAEKLEVSKQSVTNWIQEKKFPRPAVLLKLAKTLGLSFDEIILKKKFLTRARGRLQEKGKP